MVGIRRRSGIRPNSGSRQSDDQNGLDESTALRLDRAFLKLRRITAKPIGASLPVPSLGRCVDFAKVMACIAISEGTDATDSLPVKDVAAALQLEHSTASRLLADAEADALVVRSTDPNDRRRTIASLTDSGRAVVADTTAMRLAAMTELLRDWPAGDVKTLVDLLERLLQTYADRAPHITSVASDPSGCG
jgi:DNA-binding MarR family transcriptional regulator